MMKQPRPTIETLLAHRGWVRGLARSLVLDEARVDDVEQATWLTAIERPPSKPAALAGWLRRVVRSHAIDVLRAETRRAARERSSARPEHEPSTERLVAQAEIQRDVAAAVCALEEPYRTAVLLRYFEELAPREIAARLGVPVETVRTRLKRAHEQLRARLDREHGDRRAWGVLLLPFTKAKSSVPVGAATAGALAMAKTTTWASAAVVLLLAGGAAWWTWGGDRSDTDGPSTPAGDTTQAAAASRSERQRGTRSRGPDVTAEVLVAEGDKPTETAQMRLRIRRDDGLSAAGTRVVAWQQGNESAVDTADSGAEGVVELPASNAARSAVVAAPGHPLVRTTIPAGATEHEVVVRAGGTIEGVVRVNGAAPSEPLRLTIWRDDEKPWTADGEIPPGVLARLETSRRLWTSYLPTFADASGRFEFTGLTAGDLVYLNAPDGFVFSGQNPLIDPPRALRVPVRGVLIDLRELLHVSGRVVRPGGGPVDGAHVALVSEATDPNLGGGIRMVGTGPDGRFRVAASALSLRSLSLRVADPDDKAGRQVEVPVEGPLSRDLGDVELAEVSKIAIRVSDAKGHPIVGAVAFNSVMHGHEHALGVSVADVPTNAEGRATLRVWGAPPRVRIGALGFAATDVEITPDAKSPLEVVLAPSTLLDVEVLGAPPLRGDGFHLVCSTRDTRSDTPLFDTQNGLHDRVFPHAGGSAPWAEGLGEICMAADAGGEFFVSGLRSGIPIRLRLVDALGTQHADQQITLAAGERRRLELHVPPARTLSGRVADSSGRGIENAWVHVTQAVRTPGGGGRAKTRTDAEGRFTCAEVRTDRVRVTVGRYGNPRWMRADVDVPPSGRHLDVRFEPGRMLRVTLLDAKGARVVAAGMEAVRPATEPGGVELSSSNFRDDGAGHFQILDAPLGPVVVVVTLHEDDSVHRFPVADGTDDVTLTLPPVKPAK